VELRVVRGHKVLLGGEPRCTAVTSRSVRPRHA